MDSYQIPLFDMLEIVHSAVALFLPCSDLPSLLVKIYVSDIVLVKIYVSDIFYS